MDRHPCARLLLPILLACGCASGPSGNDPFEGRTQRFVVDRLALPAGRTPLAGDLDGDGLPDDQLARLVGALGAAEDAAAPEEIAALLEQGALSPELLITSDDASLRDDPSVGVRLRGAAGQAGVELTARLRGGALASEPPRDSEVPPAELLHLPIYAGADPAAVPALGLEIDLTPDATGLAGTLRGAIPAGALEEAAYPGFAQMIARDPARHGILLALDDADHDGVVSPPEFAADPIVRELLVADVHLLDGQGRWSPAPGRPDKDALSFAVAIHLTACPSGRGDSGRGAE